MVVGDAGESNLQRVFVSTDFGDAQAYDDPNGGTAPEMRGAFDSAREPVGRVNIWVTGCATRESRTQLL